MRLPCIFQCLLNYDKIATEVIRGFLQSYNE